MVTWHSDSKQTSATEVSGNLAIKTGKVCLLFALSGSGAIDLFTRRKFQPAGYFIQSYGWPFNICSQKVPIDGTTKLVFFKMKAEDKNNT